MLDLPHPVVSADGRSNVSAILLRVQCGGPNPEPQGGEDEIRSVEGPDAGRGGPEGTVRA